METVDSISRGQPTYVDALIARAARLWTYADEIYSARNIPYVSFQVLKTAPTFDVILGHIYEAGKAEAEAKYAAEIRLLDDERVRLIEEIRSLGGDPDAHPSWSVPYSLPREPLVESPPPLSKPADLGPDAFPWLKDWVDAMSARAELDTLCFELLDDNLQAPPCEWPEVIRRPVIQFTGMKLAIDAFGILQHGILPPLGESVDDYLSRFTRRVVYLHQDHSYDVAIAIVQGRWKKAANPIAYIHDVAKREHLKANGWLDPKRSKDVYAIEIPDSLDRVVAITGTPLDALIASRTDHFAEVESHLMVESAILSTKLSPLATLALYARMNGISRREAPELLGLLPSDAEAAWKALQRACPGLRKNLSV